jgi:hypothetical protein
MGAVDNGDYRKTALAEPVMDGVKTALDFILRQQEPYPAVVVARGWNVVGRNDAALRQRLAMADPEKFAAAGSAALNAMKLIFDPLRYRPFVEDWEAIALQILLRVRHEAREGAMGKPAARLLRELMASPGAPQHTCAAALPPNEPLMTVTLRKGDLLHQVYFSTLSTFGTPQDITLQELRIKCFLPGDEETSAHFQRWARTSAKPPR